jgi:peptidyl-prolyl cis-trans isomerase D
MLSILRRKAQSPLIQATVLIIALVFIFWGVGTSQKGGRNAVATVNDEVIAFQDYQKAYDQNITNLRNQFGGTLPKGLLDSLDIKSQVINQLIQRILLRQGAEEMGILVSKKEIKQAIEEMEAFRTNGAFDLQQYEAILSASRMTPTLFEASMQADLLTSKVLDNLGRFTKVADHEVASRFLYDNEKIQLEYVAFTPAAFKEKVAVDDAGLAAFYEGNKDRYKTEPEIQLSYLFFSTEETADSAAYSDEVVRSYYERNINQYSQPEQRRARHILFTSSPQDPPDIREKKLQQAEDVLQQARAGADFAELARLYSEGPSGPQGGDLGLFSRGRLVKPFEEAVFALEKGGISDIVETSFGYHIIKLEEIVPPHLTPLAEVQEDIRANLSKEAAKSSAFAAASKAYEDIILAGSMEKYAAAGATAVLETEFFTRQSPPASDGSPARKIVSNPLFLNTAFSLQKGELSSLVDLGTSYAIIYVKDLKQPVIMDLDEVREQVQENYIADRAEQLAREAAEQFLARLRETGAEKADWEEGIQQLGLKLQETDFLDRASNGGGLELPTSAIEQGFRLSAEHPYPEEIAINNTTFYVYKFQQKKEPTAANMAAKEEELRSLLLEEKKRDLLTAWLENQESRAEITINDKLL